MALAWCLCFDRLRFWMFWLSVLLSCFSRWRQFLSYLFSCDFCSFWYFLPPLLLTVLAVFVLYFSFSSLKASKPALFPLLLSPVQLKTIKKSLCLYLSLKRQHWEMMKWAMLACICLLCILYVFSFPYFVLHLVPFDTLISLTAFLEACGKFEYELSLGLCGSIWIWTL